MAGLKQQLALLSAGSVSESPESLPRPGALAPLAPLASETKGTSGISEYAQWALQDALQDAKETSKPTVDSGVQCWTGAFANAKDVCCDRSQGPTGRSDCWDGVYTFKTCCDTDRPTDISGSQRQGTPEEVSRQSRKVKGRLFTIERKLAAMESGLRWFSLVERCVEGRFTGKDFKLCFFQDARQASVHVGSFDGWEGNAMLYTGGQRCPAGPSRSMKVWLTCAGDVESLTLVHVCHACSICTCSFTLMILMLTDVTCPCPLSSQVAGCFRGLTLHLRGCCEHPRSLRVGRRFGNEG